MKIEQIVTILSLTAILATYQFQNRKTGEINEVLKAEPEDTPLPEETKAVELTACPSSLDILPEEFRINPETQKDAMNGRVIVVFKRPYLVGLYEDGEIVLTEQGSPGCFPISMGNTPFDPKFKRDHASTPEGWYHLAEKRTGNPNDSYPSTMFGHAFLVSYPNEHDVQTALEHGVINDGIAQDLLTDIRAGNIPTQTSPMGGYIMLHEWTAVREFTTEGCVGVNAPDMQWLFRNSEEGDPILLLPWRLVLNEDGTYTRDESLMERLDAVWQREFTKAFNEAKRNSKNGHVVMPEMTITGSP